MKATQLPLLPPAPEDVNCPLIVWPGGWDRHIPAWLQEAVTEERVVRAVSGGDDDLATLAEAVCYLFTAALSVPLDHEWSQIYINLAVQYMAARRAILPEDMQPRPFTEYEERLLRKLRSDIRHWQRRGQQRRRRRKQ